ncbi:MAG: glycerophosphoryl diester phosphodiesterase membrane domain-containing protein [Terriglobales bacterium]
MTVLQPMTTGELLDRTFFLYRKHFLLFLGIAAIPNLFAFAFGIGRVLMLNDVGANAPGRVAFSVFWSAMGAVVYLLAITAAQAGTIVAVSNVHLDRPASISNSFGTVGTRVFRLMFIMIGLLIAVGIAFMLLIVPGVIASLAWSLVIPVAVLEGKGLRDAAARSAALTKGDRARIFVIYFLFSLLVYLFIVVLAVPAIAALSIFSRGNPAMVAKAAPAFLVVNETVSYLAQCLATPLLSIALALVYYDERVRKEAFDLQMLMSSVQTAAATGPATATSV